MQNCWVLPQNIVSIILVEQVAWKYFLMGSYFWYTLPKAKWKQGWSPGSTRYGENPSNRRNRPHIFRLNREKTRTEKNRSISTGTARKFRVKPEKTGTAQKFSGWTGKKTPGFSESPVPVGDPGVHPWIDVDFTTTQFTYPYIHCFVNGRR